MGALLVIKIFYKPKSPWITDNIKYLMNVHGKYKRTKSPTDWDITSNFEILLHVVFTKKRKLTDMYSVQRILSKYVNL